MYSRSFDLSEKRDIFRIPELVQIACRYQSHIILRNTQGEYNAKSIMGMMSLDLRDSSMMIIADGSDEKEAVLRICEFLNVPVKDE